LDSKVADVFLAALAAGRLCLHPTDTVPGLTFDSHAAKGRDGLAALKRRDGKKPVLALCADLNRALSCFAPLPGDWEKRLARLWPGPLSVIWRAGPGAPAALVAADGTIGLRVPQLNDDAAWFADVLRRWPEPLPTTSVNHNQELPATRWSDAAAFIADAVDAFVPQVDVVPATQAVPSTVIRLHEDGGYEVLRQGAMPVLMLDASGSPA